MAGMKLLDMNAMRMSHVYVVLKADPLIELEIGMFHELHELLLFGLPLLFGEEPLQIFFFTLVGFAGATLLRLSRSASLAHCHVREKDMPEKVEKFILRYESCKNYILLTSSSSFT